ncbi:hypothetical protein F4804DRAFT_329218 [Jackrogersella minutella]|nr:hypothetical protein F4804DRAFT_329218 [Jackrogersella minutella]
MGKLTPANPRNYMPSRAHPEHRSARKALEKEHPFDWTAPVVLGMLGIGLAWDIEKQVRKREERKDREEKDREEPRRRSRTNRSSTRDPHDGDGESRGSKDRRSGRAEGSGRASDRSVARDTVDLERGRRSGQRRDRVESVDGGRHEDPRYIEDDPYYEQSRYDRGHGDDRRDRDREYHSRRGRRDSW